MYYQFYENSNRVRNYPEKEGRNRNVKTRFFSGNRLEKHLKWVYILF